MNQGSLLLLGGTSDIGGELATLLAAEREVVLVARRPEGLDEITETLHEAGATKIHILPFEATDMDSHRTLVEEAIEVAGPIGCAILAFGILGDQAEAEADEHHAVEIATLDYTAQVSMLTVLADVLRHQEIDASIVAFSSIAGWRARRANYVYGSTKAGLDAFCQGLADALHGSNVRLITARPGFVIGSMTNGMKPAPMSVTPDVVAAAISEEIHQQEEKGKVSSVTLWIPWRLRILAYIMRAVPRAVWRRMPR